MTDLVIEIGSKYVIIAKMDAASNELKHTRINSYPTIKLCKKETNEAIEFNEERILEKLFEFLEINGDYVLANPRV